MNGLPDFESVVANYEPLIKKLISKYHLMYDFDEFKQIAWIALWEAYRHFDAEKGPFPAFAAAVVRGSLLTEIKKRKKYGDREVVADRIEERAVCDHVFQTTLSVNVSRLSVREKNWLEAAVFQGLTTKEIATCYQVTQDTVRSWKKGAVKKLKQQYGQENFCR